MMQNQSCNTYQRGQQVRQGVPYTQSQTRAAQSCVQPRQAAPCAQPRQAAPCAQPQSAASCAPHSAGSCAQTASGQKETNIWAQMSREQLLRQITLTKFAMVETGLYLDTHPEDEEAIRYFQANSRIYNEAMEVYAKKFGPLTLAHAHHCDGYWNWVNQPWPWQ